jgi:hypothetical protein
VSQAKVIRDGRVAVLISPGYGAGWSTWNSRYREWALFSPEVVAWVEAGKPGGEDGEELKAIAKAAIGDDFYLGGADDLEIAWLLPGTNFRIEGYDGSESLEVSYDIKWSVA